MSVRYWMELGRNPFQGGVGFSTCTRGRQRGSTGLRRNPFQGGVGFSTGRRLNGVTVLGLCRNPFQGGVGFSTGSTKMHTARVNLVECRNPFQGGVGFSTLAGNWMRYTCFDVAIPFRVGWGFQHAVAIIHEDIAL